MTKNCFWLHYREGFCRKSKNVTNCDLYHLFNIYVADL